MAKRLVESQDLSIGCGHCAEVSPQVLSWRTKNQCWSDLTSARPATVRMWSTAARRRRSVDCVHRLVAQPKLKKLIHKTAVSMSRS